MINFWLRVSRFITVVMLPFLLGACAVKTPTISTYTLTSPSLVTVAVTPRAQSVLFINTMAADPGYSTENMIYATTPAYLRQYARHAWVAPPAQMLMPLLAAHIDAKHYFRAVVLPPFTGESNYRLSTRLVVFQQEFIQPISQVRCVIAAVLVNNHTGQVIASRRFQALVAAPGNDPEGGVAAANQAANQISEQVAQFIVANL